MLKVFIQFILDNPLLCPLESTNKPVLLHAHPPYIPTHKIIAAFQSKFLLLRVQHFQT
jgi:hypothetical protein